MTAHLISRAEVDAEQLEWEQTRLANREIEIRDNGRMVLRGVNLHNFADVVGPDRYYRHLQMVGAIEVIEPSASDKFRKAVGWILDKVRI